MQRNATYVYQDKPVHKQSGNFIRRVAPRSGGFSDTSGAPTEVKPGDILMVLEGGYLAQFRDLAEEPAAPAETEPTPPPAEPTSETPAAAEDEDSPTAGEPAAEEEEEPATTE